MASTLAPNQITAPMSPEFAADFARSGARLVVRRAGNRLLNALRRRAAFNKLMDLSPATREDIGLTAAKLAERLRDAARDEEEPLPTLARALSLLWQGLVIYGDSDSRRSWKLAFAMSAADAARRRG